MGLDFLRRTAKSSKKAWNHGKLDLSNPTLFSSQSECKTRTVLADADDGAKPCTGESVTLHLEEQEIFLVRERRRIGKVGNPPPDVLTAIRNAGGCALGHISQVYQLSGAVDVEIH